MSSTSWAYQLLSHSSGSRPGLVDCERRETLSTRGVLYARGIVDGLGAQSTSGAALVNTGIVRVPYDTGGYDRPGRFLRETHIFHSMSDRLRCIP